MESLMPCAGFVLFVIDANAQQCRRGERRRRTGGEQRQT